MKKLGVTSIGLSILISTYSVFASPKTVVGKGYSSSLHSDFENFAKDLAEQDALNQCLAGVVHADPTTWKIEYQQGYHCGGHGYCDPDVIT